MLLLLRFSTFTPSRLSRAVMLASMAGMFLCRTQSRWAPLRSRYTSGRFTEFWMFPFSR